MVAKRGKRKASTSLENDGLAGSSSSATTSAWSIEDAKKALLKVKLTAADEQGIRKVGKNSLAEAVHGSATCGKDVWKNVLRKTCALPLPAPSKLPLEGSKQTADVFHPSEIPEAVHKLLGFREGLVWFQNASYVSDVKTLMTTCGCSDLSKLESVLETVQVQVQQMEAELAAFEVPALSDGFSRMRLHKNAQGRVLISAHDELKWLGLDEDGKHNEWTNWLRSTMEEYIKGSHHSLNSRNDDSPCLEYLKLDGESIPTPMFDKNCFQKVILLCIGKSKLAGEHAEKALDIYGRHIVGDSRLDEERAANAAAAPKEAKEFVLGPEEASRQEGSVQRWLDGSLKVYVLETLQARDDAWMERIEARDDAWVETIEAWRDDAQQRIVALLDKRDDRVLHQLGRQCEQLSLKVVFAMQNSLRALMPSFSASLSQAVCFSLAQKFKDLRDDFRATVSNLTGAFIDALRKAVKLPAMKRATNPEQFPEEQRATPDEERFVESLSTLLTEELERMASQNSLFHAGRLPPLTYGAWKRCRSLVGSRCLALRKLSGDASKPLLWSSAAGGGRFNGGGQHYVYLKASRSNIGGNAKDYLHRVLKQKLKKSRQSPSVEEHLRQLIATTPPETWPISSSDMDVFQHDASEEKLGAEMEEQ